MGLTQSVYVTPAAIERVLQGETDTVPFSVDDLILAAETATSELDMAANTRFQPYWASRPERVRSPDMIRLGDDLLAVTSLTVFRNGSWTGQLVGADTYRLAPIGNPSKNPPLPYRQIEFRSALNPDTSYEITGKWGHYDVREAVAVTLADAVTDSATMIPVSILTPLEAGHTILVASEQMLITSTTGADPGDPEGDPPVEATPASLTVIRAMNGTTAAAHEEGASIDVYRYPIAGYLAGLLAQRAFKRPGNPYGVQGTADIGLIRIGINDPDVQRQLLLIKNAMVVR